MCGHSQSANELAGIFERAWVTRSGSGVGGNDLRLQQVAFSPGVVSNSGIKYARWSTRVLSRAQPVASLSLLRRLQKVDGVVVVLQRAYANARQLRDRLDRERRVRHVITSTRKWSTLSNRVGGLASLAGPVGRRTVHFDARKTGRRPRVGLRNPAAPAPALTSVSRQPVCATTTRILYALSRE